MIVTLIQSNIAWEDPSANRHQYSALINDAADSNIFILPEMFTTGFTMNPTAVAESMSGETITWMKSVAAQRSAAICGSIVIEEQGKYYNRFLFVTESGEIQYYDKRHLFTLAGENQAYEAGTSKVIIEYKDWKICLQVCYDLRFPVFSRNSEDYDLLLYVANWPLPRINAWNTLLKARAIENMCYVAGVNRVGSDNNGHLYSGQSQVIDFMGEVLKCADDRETVISTRLNKELMLETRLKLPFLNDRDRFTVD